MKGLIGFVAVFLIGTLALFSLRGCERIDAGNVGLKVPNFMIFGSKQDTVQSLQEESKGIVSVFSKTVTDLEGVNDRMTVLKEQKKQQIDQLQNEVSDINTQATQNSNLINKIKEFLS